MTRAEMEATALKLRSEGLLLREIAQRLGVACSTVSEYLNDPGGARLKARKDSYRGECEVCGGPTDGSSGRERAPTLCQTCRDWPETACLDAIRRWADEHRGVPPTCTEWRHADVDHPCAITVAKRCGGWNSALLRLGYGLVRDVRPETQDWIEEQIRSGASVTDIADEMGVTTSAIYKRMKCRGLSVRDLRRTAA